MRDTSCTPRRQFPDIKLNWSMIRRGIEEDTGALPDLEAFALFELGRLEEVLPAFLRAALH